ncbi:amidohydrolase [Sphingomonas montana]|uniref:amidohydrolase n=1 Tax=Sphingomonas montana TaxID=1843236 RepID=UPI00096CF4F8|nr:amidohydrolase [Sphingomonas montana]
MHATRTALLAAAAILLATAPAQARRKAVVLPAPPNAGGLIDNINGYTIDQTGRVQRFTGMLIDKAGRVAKLYQSGDTREKWLDFKLDAKGRTLLPGLIDAHGHVMELGFRATELDLAGSTSLADAKAKLADYARERTTPIWIRGGGWNQERWGLGRFPTAADIDGVVRDRPVALARVDGHAMLANSAALAAAGITAKTPDPAGGRIERDAKGNPTGVLVDAAQALLERAIPQPLPRERDVALASAQDQLLAFGIVATADMGTTPDDWNTYRRAGDAGRLRIRLISYAGGIEPMLSIAGTAPTPWLYDTHLKMVGVKLYDDGALGSRGAWLKRPYADAANQRGLPFLDDTRLRNLMSRAAMDGFQVAIHAIGDAANAQALDAIEEVALTYKGDRRWRIEHAQIVDPADLKRFGRNGIVASMQPVHQTSDRTMAEARLGEARLAGAYAWKSMVDAGAKLAFGSDYPVESPDPFAGIAAAISREDPSGQPPGGWHPEQKVDLPTALAAFTSGAAYASFTENMLGSLAPGHLADFILVDTDPFAATPMQIRATKVQETWIGGKRVFLRK